MYIKQYIEIMDQNSSRMLTLIYGIREFKTVNLQVH